MFNETRTMLGAAFFLLIIAIIYVAWSVEPTGTVLLLFGFFAYGMLGGWMLLQWRRRKRVPRPEDRPDATMEEGAGEIGYFPAASMWPAGIGLGGIMLGIALIYGSWWYLVAGIFLFGAIAGFVVEAEARDRTPEEAVLDRGEHYEGRPFEAPHHEDH